MILIKFRYEWYQNNEHALPTGKSDTHTLDSKISLSKDNEN